MPLGLRGGGVAVHCTLVLLGFLGVARPWGVNVAHQEARVIPLALEDVDLTVSGPAALGAGPPESGPGRTSGWKFDARLGVEASTRRCIQHLAVFRLSCNHAGCERRIVSGVAVLACAGNLRTIPLGFRRRIPGGQAQVPIMHGDVIRAVRVLRL